MTDEPAQAGSGEYRGWQILYDMERKCYVSKGFEADTLDAIIAAINRVENDSDRHRNS